MGKLTTKEARQRRHRRVRAQVSGTAAVPRLSVCRTESHMYVQFIDDEKQHTVVSASTLDAVFRSDDFKMNKQSAASLGRLAAERALAANIKKVVFDRGGFRFHGRVKALADAAREAGLVF